MIGYLIQQATSAGTVSAKPTFGEYGVYVDGKMIGSVRDDQLFVKPTTSDRVRYARRGCGKLVFCKRWRLTTHQLRFRAFLNRTLVHLLLRLDAYRSQPDFRTFGEA